MTKRSRSKAVRGTHALQATGRNVAKSPAQSYDEGFSEQPFAEGLQEGVDPDLRHRMISELAFHRQVERGYDEGYDREDWLDAEAEVDHIVIGPGPG